MYQFKYKYRFIKRWSYSCSLNLFGTLLKMSFANKVVIVTGSSAGIGATTAVAFAKEGAEVTITGRNVDNLKKVEKEIERLSGKRPLAIVGDISKDDDAKKIVTDTVNHFGKLDILVNNAGLSSYRSIFDLDYLDQFDRIMSTNLRAAVVMTHAAMPHLVKTKGNIVMVSSIAGVAPAGLLSHYCTSKAGLDHFSRSVASEVASKGVRVNVVGPGPVKTDINQNAGVSGEKLTAAVKQMPLGFITECEEVADLILYLASDKARSVTGSTYAIDIGVALHGFNGFINIMHDNN